RLSGKYWFRARKREFEPDEIALALMHRNEADANQNEGQNERQIVVVVHRTQQHRESHDAEYDADAGRQDVDPSGP
ncbi:MAG: hypothetical protein OEQ30_04005, partial [Gammaproteobacteria bacterium]|nr:hypothetical protein [Gammaproteobacteria bacterium]